MITKNTILITSIGRTGTEFFSKFFADIVPDCSSLHEPDIVQFVGVENRIKHLVRQVQRAGVWRMLFLKPLGKWTLVKLSDARFLGRIDYGKAVNELRNQRERFILKLPGSIYVESNIGYYGLLDVCSDVFQSHRIIYIVRDGRDWIRSSLNWGEIYKKKGPRKILSHAWPAAKDMTDDPLAGQWDDLSIFEQLCWVWTRLNEYALRSASRNPHARVFSFEKIFVGEDKYTYLGDLVKFATALSDIDSRRLGNIKGWLERKTHQSSSNFPAWEEWTSDQKRQFKQICGPLMEELGYTF